MRIVLMFCLLSLFASSLSGNEVRPRALPEEAGRRMELELLNIAIHLSGREPHLDEMRDRFAILRLLYAEKNEEKDSERLVNQKRADLLSRGLFDVLKLSIIVQNIKIDEKQIHMMKALARIGDKRALPYCLLVLKHTGMIGGSEEATIRALLINNTIWTIRVLCGLEGKANPTALELAKLDSFNSKKPTMQAAEKYLKEHLEYAKGFADKGEEFKVPETMKKRGCVPKQ